MEKLQLRLDSGAEDADALDGAWGQVLRGDGAGDRGADVRQERLVEQQAGRFAGALAEEEHQAVARGEAQRRVAGEAGGDLDDVVVAAVNVAVLDVDLAVREEELADGRDCGPAGGVVGEAALDGGDQVELREDLLDLLAVDDLHVYLARHRSGRYKCLSLGLQHQA